MTSAELHALVTRSFPMLTSTGYQYMYNPVGRPMMVIDAETPEQLRDFYRTHRSSNTAPRLTIRPLQLITREVGN
ncbi:hypothetical protein DPMN_098242 [Dreissena polymorpha]|uniref:Uncharacterized protein n=1 Tax=Dreissena polymorpha TaxID=45954 RepID=A0A9D4LEB6_DREPO|nr:hypothetical protein DPMN_098242 [Dreissena polymorpha]